MAQQWNQNHAYGNSFQHNGHVFGNVNHYGGNALDLREQIMSNLSFPGMWTYRSRELNAYDGTYGWMFDRQWNLHDDDFVDIFRRVSKRMDDGDLDRSEEALKQALSEEKLDYRTTFVKWLQSDDDRPFWIHGKAGSGKSTLMKYISEHQRTIEAFKESPGAAECEPVVVRFFAWSAGGTLEKTVIGLLRSLLYQLLDKCTTPVEEVEQICPGRKKSAGHAAGQLVPWGKQELVDSVRRITKSEDNKFRFLFFIDGIDEFEEATRDGVALIDDLRSLSASGSVKVCISGRPWRYFQNEYGRSEWQVAIHNHTARDMERFVTKELREVFLRDEMSNLTEADLRSISTLIGVLAEGVFLWVVLVVRSVRNGLAEVDDCKTLCDRINKYPKELDEMFWRIFDGTIDSCYHKYAARTLLMMQAEQTSAQQSGSQQSDSLLGSLAESGLLLPTSMLELRGQPVNLIQLAMLRDEADNPDFALVASLEALSCEEFEKKAREARVTVSKWCKELVISHPNDRGVCTFATFCHRSMIDFVKEKEDMLRKKAGNDFHVDLARLRISLRYRKYSLCDSGWHPFGIANRLMKMVDLGIIENKLLRGLCSNWRQERPEIRSEMSELVYELGKIIQSHREAPGPSLEVEEKAQVLEMKARFDGAVFDDPHFFLTHLICKRLDEAFWAVLDHQNKEQPESQSLRDEWLELAVIPRLSSKVHLPCADPDTVRCLIKRGADVNALCTGHRPHSGLEQPSRLAQGVWPQMLIHVWKIGQTLYENFLNRAKQEELNNILSVVMAMLDSGCDPNATLKRDDVMSAGEGDIKSMWRRYKVKSTLLTGSGETAISAREMFDPALIREVELPERKVTKRLKKLQWLFAQIRTALDEASQVSKQVAS